MSEKIKVGNVEVEKANYDYFSLMYEKMPKEYVVADLVSKCEDYDKLYKNYEMKDLQIEEIRKELINQEKYIGQLKNEYNKEIERLNNIINELEKWAKSIQLTVYRSDNMPVYQHQDVLDKLQELKGSE